MNEAFIYDAVRTPRGKGKPGGALYEVKPIELLRKCLDAIRTRNELDTCLLYTSPSPRDATLSRMPSSA